MTPELEAWCARHLGSPPQAELFRHAGMSEVIGLRLADGREVVLKLRRPEARLAACAVAQRRLFDAGFPCPEPLAGPAPLEELSACAEAYVPGGERLTDPEACAGALAEQVRMAPAPAELPSLDPAPAWAWWDYPGPGTWAWQSEPELALARERGWKRDRMPPPELPWLEEYALGARAKLARFHAEPVVGHTDWWPENVRWLNGRLLVVHDWDSLAALPEAVICGCAASIFAEWPLFTWPDNLLDLSAAFIEGYARARGRSWSAEEHQACWAASLWMLVYDLCQAGEAAASKAAAFEGDAIERVRLAGA